MVKKLIMLLCIAAAAVFILSCKQPATGTGHVSLKMYLEGYPFSETLQADVSVDSRSRGISLQKTVDFSYDFYASAYFPNIEPGMYTLTIRYIDGDSEIGSPYTVDVEAMISQTVITTVNGRYADGVLTFTAATETSGTQTSMSLDKCEALLIARAQGSASNVNVEKNVYIFGGFETLNKVTVEYPDGLLSTMENRALGNRAFSGNEAAWIAVSERQITAGRQVDSENISEISESGTYRITLEDDNGSVIQAEDSIDVTVPTEFLPAITNPIDGGTVPAAGSWNADWTYGNALEVKSLAVVIFDRDSPDTAVFTALVYDPQSVQSVSVPDSACSAGPNYQIIVAAFDTGISESTIASLRNYNYNDFISGIAENSELPLNAAAMHIVSFTGL